jgi:hypothetical protein
MFNLLISGNDEAWTSNRYDMMRSRVFEYTDDSVTARYSELSQVQLDQLYALPALFAYETGVQKNARLGRISRIRFRGSEVRIEYTFSEELPEITPKELKELVWELDIGSFELGRTHWAVKDVDLVAALETAGLITKAQIRALPEEFRRVFVEQPEPEAVPIRPTIFRVPPGGIEADLVSVMLPFQPQFAPVLAAISSVGHELALRVQSANDVWNESEIIQDIFSLIYRSSAVVCDFSDRNANVFYEAGIAHTLGRPMIPLVQRVEDIPFDLQHHRHIDYLNNGEGIEDLKAQLRPRLAKLTGRR